jgi:membrane protein YqaA with SNARE-associated domain
MGYYLTNLKDKKWFPINRLHLTRASSWFLKYGKWTLFLSWVPIIGDPLTIIAGVFRVQIHVFILIVSLAKTMRYIFISLVATNVL